MLASWRPFTSQKLSLYKFRSSSKKLAKRGSIKWGKKSSQGMAAGYSCSISFVLLPSFLFLLLLLFLFFSCSLNQYHSTDLSHSSFTPSINLPKTKHKTPEGVVATSVNKNSTHKARIVVRTKISKLYTVVLNLMITINFYIFVMNRRKVA